MNTKKLPKRSVVKQTESPIEDKIFFWFRRYDLFPEVQYQIGSYRVDFYFKDLNLVVEADGKKYHSSPEQKERDKKRDEFIRSKGYKIFRFTGSEIYNEPWEISKKIIEEYYKPREARGHQGQELTEEEFSKYWEIRKSGYAGYM